MKIQILVSFVVLFLLSCCTNNSLHSDDENFKMFAENYDDKKLPDLELLLKSFDKFLAENFSDTLSENEKIIQFLENAKCINNITKENWAFDLRENKKLIDRFEKSGLRKDFWLYGYELNELQKDDEIIPISMDSASMTKYKLDSIRQLKMRMQTVDCEIVKALEKLNINDTIITNYIDARNFAGNISNSILIDAILMASEHYNYNNVFMKLILVEEIYSGLLYNSVLEEK